MAGGKQTPRQKLVSLMYLVFLAMMAMSMGKEVLSAFGSLKDTLVKNNAQADTKNEASYADLSTKAVDQAKKYAPLKEKADKIQELSTDLYNYIEDIKKQALEGVEDPTNYETMDKSDALDQKLFQGDGYSALGKEFVGKIDAYRKAVDAEMKDYPDLLKSVNKMFDTKDVINREKVKMKWLNYNYEGFPLVASLTKLTQLQSYIKTTESDVLSNLLQGQMTKDVSMTNYDAMVVFDKNAYYPGEQLSGKIVLGKNDPTLMAEKVEINGKEWPKDKIKAGQVIIDGPAGSVGDKELKGTFFFKEGDSIVKLPIKGGYSVIPRPNEAVISADKMNVVYKGLSNPLTISIPGIPGNKVSASAPGLRRTKGNSYMMNPTGKGSVKINVSGTLPDGKKVSSSKTFRIKDIPPAVAMVRGQYATVSLPKSSLSGISVGAGLPDFLFDLKLNVSSFKIKVPGQVTVPVTGTRMNARAKQAIAKARRGDQVTIFDVKASVSGSSYRIKKVLPVVVKISN